MISLVVDNIILNVLEVTAFFCVLCNMLIFCSDLHVLTIFFWNTFGRKFEIIKLKIGEKEYSCLHTTGLVDVAFQAWSTLQKEHQQHWLSDKPRPYLSLILNRKY